MGFTLRDYQKAAVSAVLSGRKAGIRRMLVCLPTGAGKTVIISELCRQARQKVLILAHRDELLRQAKEKIGRSAKGKTVSIEQGTAKAPPDADIVVASIRTLHQERLDKLVKHLRQRMGGQLRQVTYTIRTTTSSKII